MICLSEWSAKWNKIKLCCPKRLRQEQNAPAFFVRHRSSVLGVSEFSAVGLTSDCGFLTATAYFSVSVVFCVTALENPLLNYHASPTGLGIACVARLAFASSSPWGTCLTLPLDFFIFADARSAVKSIVACS